MWQVGHGPYFEFLNPIVQDSNLRLDIEMKYKFDYSLKKDPNYFLYLVTKLSTEPTKIGHDGKHYKNETYQKIVLIKVGLLF